MVRGTIGEQMVIKISNLSIVRCLIVSLNSNMFLKSFCLLPVNTTLIFHMVTNQKIIHKKYIILIIKLYINVIQNVTIHTFRLLLHRTEYCTSFRIINNMLTFE